MTEADYLHTFRMRIKCVCNVMGSVQVISCTDITVADAHIGGGKMSHGHDDNPSLMPIAEVRVGSE